MKASDVMTRTVLTVTGESSLEDAARLMVENRISGLPVLDDEGAVVGMITEGDLLRRTEINTSRDPGWFASVVAPVRAARNYARSHARKVGEMSGCEVISVVPDTPLAEVVAIMESCGIRRVPVLEKRRLVGIVSRADLVKALLKSLDKGERVCATDEQIRERFFDEVDRQQWAPRIGVDSTVTDGVIELRGIISDEQMRTALRIIAENAPGVRGIRDHLVCIEPFSGAIISAGSDERPAV